MKITEIKKYVRQYDPEKYLFEDIGPRVKERGYFKFSEFYEICMWKSVRPKKKYLKNKNSIEKMSGEAFLEKDDVKQIKILCKLNGVGVPIASALLTVVYPEKYAVIDIRCLKILKSNNEVIGAYPSFKNWKKYLEIMRRWSKENDVTPRQLDMALYAMHKEKSNRDGKNLYED